MALNKSLICSQAAYYLGLNGFTDIENETTDEANIMNRLYDWALDSVLREHSWNFAMKRVILATEVATPVWGYTKQATLPSDFIREIRINKNGYAYKIENGKIVSNQSTLKLLYIARITNPGLYPPHFGECLALKIAIKACNALIRKTDKMNYLQSEYKKALITAKRIDASEGEPENLVIQGLSEDIFGVDLTHYDQHESE